MCITPHLTLFVSNWYVLEQVSEWMVEQKEGKETKALVGRREFQRARAPGKGEPGPCVASRLASKGPRSKNKGRLLNAVKEGASTT